MVRNYGRFKRLALSGIASAALGASLILPATALAYSPDSLSIALAGNGQNSEQNAGNLSLQGQFVQSHQDASQGALVIDPVKNIAETDVSGKAINSVQGGDVHVEGNSPHVAVFSGQGADAAANGDAIAVNNTGDANTFSGAASIGGSSEQSNNQSADHNGISGDAWSSASHNLSVPISGQVSGDATGSSGALSAILNLGFFGIGGPGSPVGPNSYDPSNHGSQGSQSSANSLDATNSGNFGKNSSSAANTSSATTGSAVGSGSNTGPNTNQADTSGGAASSGAVGGNTGANTATSVVAGGIAGNSLTVGVDASGSTAGTGGAVTNTGGATSNTGAIVDQSASPINTVSQTNDATQITKAEQSNPQVAAALSKQNATSTSTNTNTSTKTIGS